jgi:hypothetical protein
VIITNYAPKAKRYHMAAKINPEGGVCFARPRAIDLRRATWTLRAEAVTCPKRMAVLRAAG